MASSANCSLPSGKKWYSDEKRASALVRISLMPVAVKPWRQKRSTVAAIRRSRVPAGPGEGGVGGRVDMNSEFTYRGFWLERSIQGGSAVYKAAVRWMIRRNVAALRSGDPAPLLAGYADDAVLIFPGPTVWSGRVPREGGDRRLPAAVSKGRPRRRSPRHPGERTAVADHGVRSVHRASPRRRRPASSMTTGPSSSLEPGGARSTTTRTSRTPTRARRSPSTWPGWPPPAELPPFRVREFLVDSSGVDRPRRCGVSIR